MKQFQRRAVALPLAALAFGLAILIALDVIYGGDAKPAPLLGAVGSPVRGTFVPPTATVVGAGPTPRPRPTFEGVVSGTAAERDEKRRTDLLRILGALEEWRTQRGAYISTSGNVQSLCVFREADEGCALAEIMGGDVPHDPRGNGAQDGYWYSSDGRTLKIYADLEQDLADEERCETDNVDLQEKASLICLEAP